VKAKNMPPRKSVDMVLSVCEEILCQSVNDLTAQEKDTLLGTLAQYSAMKWLTSSRTSQQKWKN